MIEILKYLVSMLYDKLRVFFNDQGLEFIPKESRSRFNAIVPFQIF